jgi:hypothetical protein
VYEQNFTLLLHTYMLRIRTEYASMYYAVTEILWFLHEPGRAGQAAQGCGAKTRLHNAAVANPGCTMLQEETPRPAAKDG